ncbi:hypothetical protein, partial [Comamonas composti]|uniref:hypothetical protein n=1 Tax=Comamonas composti TaxID=408558 RepID=UPI001B7FD062
MAVSFLEAFVPVKKRGPGDLADPAVVALCVTPIRKVIDPLPCPALGLQEVAMSKVGKTLGLPIVNARAAGIDIGARI